MQSRRLDLGPSEIPALLTPSLLLSTPHVPPPDEVGWATLLRELPWEWAQRLPAFKAFRSHPRAGIGEGAFCLCPWQVFCLQRHLGPGQRPASPPPWGLGFSALGLLLAGGSGLQFPTFQSTGGSVRMQTIAVTYVGLTPHSSGRNQLGHLL